MEVCFVSSLKELVVVDLCYVSTGLEQVEALTVFRNPRRVQIQRLHPGDILCGNTVCDMASLVSLHSNTTSHLL